MTLEEAGRSREPRPVPNTPDSVFAQLSMKGKVVAITGAADGIGLAVAEAVAEAGANVALWYNSNNAAIVRAKELEERYQIKAKAYQVEVTDYTAVEKTMKTVVDDFGKLDVFVANAGMAISKAITETSIEEYNKQMAVNGKYTLNLYLISVLILLSVDGVFYCAKYAGAIFKNQGFGNLIITSSISAHIVNVPVDQPVCIHPHIFDVAITDACRSTTPRKPRSTISERVWLGSGATLQESTSSRRVSSTPKWAQVPAWSMRRIV